MSNKKQKHKNAGLAYKGQALTPRQRGLKSFESGNFAAAIAVWSTQDTRDEKLKNGLAEAYFRNALVSKNPADQVANLRLALKLYPLEARYEYHLGLALHRSNDLTGAIESYRKLLQQRPNWAGVGMALALASLEQDPQSKLEELPGSTPVVLAALAPVQAILNKTALPPVNGTPLEKLFQAIQLLSTNPEKAHELLQDKAKLPLAAARVQQYYRGVTALKLGNNSEALQLWLSLNEQEVKQPGLRANLVALLMEELAKGQELQALVPPSSQLVELAAVNPVLGDRLLEYLDRKAQAVATTGNWQLATALWQAARRITSSSPTFGSPRSFTHNLALAAEAQEKWLLAAQEWRALLRTRPRSNAKTEAPADYSEEQWAWARKKVIDCYKLAGEPGEAVSVFRQAIKASPDDLDLRIQFIEALLANDQPQAAFNELQRILVLNPDHYEAQLMLANLQVQEGQWLVALQRLRTLREKYPEKEELRQQLAAILLKFGQVQQEMGYLEGAQNAFEEGQKLTPEDFNFPLWLARLAIDQKKYQSATDLLETTLKLGQKQPAVYLLVLDCWIAADNLAKARELIARCEADIRPDTELYAQLAMVILKRKAVKPEPDIFEMLGISSGRGKAKAPTLPPETVWNGLAEELLQKASQLKPEDPQTYISISAILLTVRPDMALPYAREAVRLGPKNPRSYISLGLALALDDQTQEAKKTLKQGATLARQQNDPALAREIDEIRQEIDSPLFGMLKDMGPMSGLLDIFDEEEEFDFF